MTALCTEGATVVRGHIAPQHQKQLRKVLLPDQDLSRQQIAIRHAEGRSDHCGSAAHCV
jgi:hypothetical protein